jgi:hypothetical protein
MNGKLLSVLLLLSALTVPVLSSAASAPSGDRGSSDLLRARLAAHVRALASTEMAGRKAGTDREEAAAALIVDAFVEVGLSPLRGEPGTASGFLRPFLLDSTGAILVCAPGEAGAARSPKSRGMSNVIGAVGLDLPGRALLIGAHYDHLGVKDGAIYFGADDNASGVALLIEVARSFAARNPWDGPVIFAAFTGEEEGLLGSRAYVSDPPFPLERTAAMVNIDMVGRLGEGKLLFATQGLAEGARAALADSVAARIPRAEMRSGYDAGDLASFAEARVPSLLLFTGAHEDYHRPSDTEDKIDFEGLARVTELAGRVAPLFGVFAGEGFVGEPSVERLSPLAGGAAAPRPFLGTVPDMAAPPGDGVLIAGVAAGSPAEIAGIRPGDRVVGLAGQKVADLKGYAEALREKKPGDVVAVEVRRGTETLVFQATLIVRPEGAPGGRPGGGHPNR